MQLGADAQQNFCTQLSSHSLSTHALRRMSTLRNTDEMFGCQHRSYGGFTLGRSIAIDGFIHVKIGVNGFKLKEAKYTELEQLHRSQETRKFYQKLNVSRKGFVPRAKMCRDKNGSTLTDNREVAERWKQPVAAAH
ncbi:uncharacterized protein LOC129779590 [Toxorhynchites rutilus septentrionalis]|uniref:uncharacterized protein LOC129779590 n=1 Tax=Toxorhynchites rutilus septentrionalis TaxID=329112 RepID=UPI002478F097|nr:uncharacterized protein LOC129779590 [Toxorhynchites rutilus septentrionalis]